MSRYERSYWRTPDCCKNRVLTLSRVVFVGQASNRAIAPHQAVLELGALSLCKVPPGAGLKQSTRANQRVQANHSSGLLNRRVPKDPIAKSFPSPLTTIGSMNQFWPHGGRHVVLGAEVHVLLNPVQRNCANCVGDSVDGVVHVDDQPSDRLLGPMAPELN